MGPNGETLLHPFPTATAVLAGVGRWHSDDSAASVCCFAFEDGPELRPAGITDALSQVRVLDQVSHLQIFQIDHVVVPQQLQGGLMMKVSPLPLHFLVLPSEECHRFAAALTALLPARDTPLRLLEGFLRFPVVPRIFDDVALGGDKKHLQANVDARLLTGEWDELHRHIHAGETAVPAVGFFGDGDGLDCAFKRAAPSDANAPDLGEDEAPVVEHGTVAELFVGETCVAVGALEAGIAGLLTGLDAAKERLEGTVQTRQHILQDLRVDVLVLRPNVFDGGQFGTLMSAGDARVAFLPGVAAFLQRGIVEFAAATQHKRHLLLLPLSRQKFILEGLADSRRIHTDSFAQMFVASKTNGP